MTHHAHPALSRRRLLGAGGALVVSVFAPGLAAPAMAAPDATLPGAATRPPRTPDQLDTWLAVQQNGTVLAFFGKMDPGQGVGVAIGQIVAEELDVPFDRVQVVMGDTGLTVNQGGASGATGIEKGGVPLRNAAAEARRVLLGWAASHLDVPQDQLGVSAGVISDRRDPAKSVTYGELIGGRYFDVPLHWNGVYGNDLVATGAAKPKAHEGYTIVGQSVPRADIADKVFARYTFVTDIKLPGMLHARMIRPPVAGSVPVAVDATSLAAIEGARMVWNKGVLAVLAPREWDAIRAVDALVVEWSQVSAPFPDQTQLHAHIRNAPAIGGKTESQHGQLDPAFAAAAKVVEAEYLWPFQSHASLGPACAVADVRADEATLWTGSQKPHFGRDGVARLLGLPVEKVRAIWVAGPGSYGRNDAGDAALDAAFLSKAVGAPVRVQGTRAQATAWDPKGPASLHRGRAAFDASGEVVAYDFHSKGFSRTDVDTNESDPRDTLVGQLQGMGANFKAAFGAPGEEYGFAARRLYWEVISPLLATGSPLRSAHLRDPVGPQMNFASESFIDELAVAAGMDAVAFRLKYVTNPRGIAVIKAAAEKAGWESRPSASRVGSGDVVSGRGIAFAQRAETLVATVAVVEVDRASGAIRARRVVVAHDCGLVINPDGLRRCIEGNVIHALSRGAWEEVAFDARGVTSIDWVSYPILEIAQAPDAIDIVLIDRPELPPAGGGEASSRPMAAAVANAIFDATGVRLRQAPFTPERIKAALA
jgi:CO/xanthine dehydrogenase Mo-binding subunit